LTAASDKEAQQRKDPSMRSKKAILAGILLAATVAPASARPRPQIAVAADAAAAVRRSAAYLQGLSSLTLDAQLAIDGVDEDGKRVHEIGILQYEYSAADGLFVEWGSSGERRQLYSNGYIVTFVLPASATYVTVPKLASDATTGIAAENIDIMVPLPDFFVWAMGAELANPLRAVRHLGRQRIDGMATDHYAVRQDGIDFEVWIDRGARPLPRRIRIAAPADPEAPRFTATLRWTIEPRLAASRFTFTPPAGARRIEEEDAKARGFSGPALRFDTSLWSTCGRMTPRLMPCGGHRRPAPVNDSSLATSPAQIARAAW
jgi:hypothetical protein